MISDKKILKTLARTLNIETTLESLSLDQQQLKAALLRAAGDKAVAARVIPLDTKPVGPGPLTLFIDGASRGNPGPAGAGVVASRDDKHVESTCQYLGHATNNQAEYSALILALERALDLGATQVEIRSDSELLVRQINGQYKVKNAGLKPLFEKARTMIAKLESFGIKHVPRELNQKADAMANRAIDEFA